jgi:hypothetical protein
MIEVHDSEDHTVPSPKSSGLLVDGLFLIYSARVRNEN